MSSDQQTSATTSPVNESSRTHVPDILKDPTAEGGVAPLAASYFERSLKVPHLVENFSVDTPVQWLLNSLIKRQETLAHHPKKVNSV